MQGFGLRVQGLHRQTTASSQPWARGAVDIAWWGGARSARSALFVVPWSEDAEAAARKRGTRVAAKVVVVRSIVDYKFELLALELLNEEASRLAPPEVAARECAVVFTERRDWGPGSDVRRTNCLSKRADRSLPAHRRARSWTRAKVSASVKKVQQRGKAHPGS